MKSNKLIIIVALIAALYFFRDKIKPFINKIFKRNEA